MKHRCRHVFLPWFAALALGMLGSVGCDQADRSSSPTEEPAAGGISLDEAPADPAALLAPSDTSAWESEDPQEFQSLSLALEQAPPGDTADANAVPDGADVYHLLVVWGRPVFTPNAKKITDWTGQIRVTAGTIRPLRLVRFDLEDHLVADNDPTSVHFVSKTRPHHDGLLLRIVAPAGANGEVVFQTGPLTKSFAFSELAHLHAAVPTGGGEGVLFVGKAFDPACAGGFLKGFWKRSGPHGGLLGGAWFNAQGDAVAKVLGIWGQRKDGKRLLFAMLVSPSGLKGVIAGTYAPFPVELPGVLDGGMFKGLLIGPGLAPLAGFKGAYTEPVVPGKGFFLGGWTPASCLDLPKKPCADGADAATCVSDEATPMCDCAGSMPCTCSMP